MKTVLAAIGAATILGLPTVGRAECIRVWKDIPDAKRMSPLVFSGTVAEIKGDPDGIFVTFDVDRVWNGAAKRRLVVPLYMTLDSVRFVKGESYVVFAGRHVASPDPPGSMKAPTVSEPVFEVSICSPTKPLDQARDVLAALGPGSKPK